MRETTFGCRYEATYVGELHSVVVVTGDTTGENNGLGVVLEHAGEVA